MKLLVMTLPDGSKWGVPVDMIARNRANHYASEFGGDVERSLAEDTRPLFEADSYCIEDWAVNNMNWSDFNGFQVLVASANIGLDLQSCWLSEPKEVINFDSDVTRFVEAKLETLKGVRLDMQYHLAAINSKNKRLTDSMVFTDCPLSSQVHSIGHHAATNLMVVRFHTKDKAVVAEYHYHNVPPEVFAAGLVAPSIGKFLNDVIKPGYICVNNGLFSKEPRHG